MVNLCAPGAPKGPKVGMFVRQYEIVCANDAGRAPRKYPGRVLLPATSTDDVKGMSSFNDLKTIEECAKFHEAYQQTGLFLWDCT